MNEVGQKVFDHPDVAPTPPEVVNHWAGGFETLCRDSEMVVEALLQSTPQVEAYVVFALLFKHSLYQRIEILSHNDCGFRVDLRHHGNFSHLFGLRVSFLLHHLLGNLDSLGGEAFRYV